MGVYILLAALLGGGSSPDGDTLVTAGNSTINAREIALSAEGSDLLVKYVDVGGQAGTLKAADLVEIAFNGGRAAASGRALPEDIEIVLTTGDLLVGKVGPKSDDGVHLISPVFSNPLVKFGQIRAVLFPANRAFLPLRLPEKADTADIILTQSGDRAEGTLLTISDAGVVYKSKRLDKDITVPLDKAAGV